MKLHCRQMVPAGSPLILAKQQFNGSLPLFQSSAKSALLFQATFPELLTRLRLYTCLTTFCVSLKPLPQKNRRKLKIKVFFKDADSWMVVAGIITVSGTLLGALFTAWIFSSYPFCFPSFPYCAVEYTSSELLTNNWYRFEQNVNINI